jgi:nucleoside-diphosphate-sugar epimerase
MRAAGLGETRPKDCDERATVLVTGAGGFIGRHLVRRLEGTGMRVHATVREGAALVPPPPGTTATFHRVDLRDRIAVADLFAAVRPDYVFNLVRGRGEATPGERWTVLESTLWATASVIEAATAVGARRLVQIGSPTEYGPTSGRVTEDTALSPTTLFGAAKGAATLLCLAAAASERLPAVLRPFVVYGPGSPANRLIPSAIAAAMNGSELPLTRPGLRRDWIFVHDVVDACLAALDGGADGEVVNVATGVQHTNEEVVDLVERATRRRVRRQAGAEPERPWDSTSWVADVGKAERLLGWKAKTPLERGIELTMSASRASEDGEPAISMGR